MKKLFTTIALISISSLLFSGCDKKESSATSHSHAEHTEKKADTAGEGHNHEGHDHAHHADDPKAGKQLDPPISADEVPAGAWYCDMGTVEYYSFDKGDGKCPFCGMPLKHKE